MSLYHDMSVGGELLSYQNFRSMANAALFDVMKLPWTRKTNPEKKRLSCPKLIDD